MNPSDLIQLILSAILAVIGLICSVLERLGRLKPVLRRTGTRISYASGGVYVLIAAIMGFVNLYPYTWTGAIGYPLLLGAAHLLIRLLVHPKNEGHHMKTVTLCGSMRVKEVLYHEQPCAPQGKSAVDKPDEQ